MKKSFFLLVLTIFISSSAFAQISSKNLTPPSKGKSVIYFLRTTSLGAIMNVRYFDDKKYLGRFNGKNYIRYETRPGEKTFWIKAENVDVLKVNLKAGKIYLVETNMVMGLVTGGTKFRLVNNSKKSQVKRINKLLNKKEPLKFSKATLDKQFNKMQKTYKNSLKKVQKKIKKGKVTTLSSSSYYKKK